MSFTQIDVQYRYVCNHINYDLATYADDVLSTFSTYVAVNGEGVLS